MRRFWHTQAGKGGRERRVPVDAQVAGWVQTYLLAERPETDTTVLVVVAKGPHRGRPLTPAGLRTIFRYHRESGRGAGGAPARAAALVRYLPWPQPGEGRGARGWPGTCLTSIRNSFVQVATFAT